MTEPGLKHGLQLGNQKLWNQTIKIIQKQNRIKYPTVKDKSSNNNKPDMTLWK